MAQAGFPTPDLLLGEDHPGPPNSATPEELEAHPGLAQLLRSLGELLGRDGLSPHLQKELRQAEGTLGRARRLWLQQELLWRLLEELIRDPRDLEPSLLRALEQELTWAQVRRERPEMAQLLPHPQRPPILPRLLPELERRLREKREELRGYLLGPPQNPPNLPPNPPKMPSNAPNLGGLLRAERFQLLRERLRQQLLRRKVERLSWKYAEVLRRCLSHLRRCRSLVVLQAHLDQGRGRYLLAKGEAMLLKTRLEELQILLDTYPAPTIEAHRRIRAGLLERRRAAETEAANLGAELATLRGLGPAFQELAQELGQIRQELAEKELALCQLRSPPP